MEWGESFLYNVAFILVFINFSFSISKDQKLHLHVKKYLFLLLEVSSVFDTKSTFM